MVTIIISVHDDDDDDECIVNDIWFVTRFSEYI